MSSDFYPKNQNWTQTCSSCSACSAPRLHLAGQQGLAQRSPSICLNHVSHPPSSSFMNAVVWLTADHNVLLIHKSSRFRC